MPLLTSPIDGAPMRQINRYGIEIDVCPTSGGIWLDKGELEKLMALLREEALNDDPLPHRPIKDARYSHPHSHPHSRPHDDDYDDDRYERKYDRDSGHYRKKSKMSKIMDIFDF